MNAVKMGPNSKSFSLGWHFSHKWETWETHCLDSFLPCFLAGPIQDHTSSKKSTRQLEPGSYYLVVRWGEMVWTDSDQVKWPEPLSAVRRSGPCWETRYDCQRAWRRSNLRAEKCSNQNSNQKSKPSNPQSCAITGKKYSLVSRNVFGIYYLVTYNDFLPDAAQSERGSPLGTPSRDQRRDAPARRRSGPAGRKCAARHPHQCATTDPCRRETAQR